ncbi:MAG: hypothetical protein A2X48_09340 [Lentisphaerae bacterium GWF2_49_21]|nr:MAG: hypothetical protein A2X48_09340 [Lentisphaerae bacterium GWF2_49_21]
MCYDSDYNGWFPPFNQNPNWLTSNTCGCGAYVHGLGMLNRPRFVTTAPDSPAYTTNTQVFYCPNLNNGTAPHFNLDSRFDVWHDLGGAGYFYLGNPWHTADPDAWNNLIFERLLVGGDTNLWLPTGFIYGSGRMENRSFTPDKIPLTCELMQENGGDSFIRMHFPGSAWPSGKSGGNVVFGDGHASWLKGTNWGIAGGANGFCRPAIYPWD